MDATLRQSIDHEIAQNGVKMAGQGLSSVFFQPIKKSCISATLWCVWLRLLGSNQRPID